jgi:hypothetical protein
MANAPFAAPDYSKLVWLGPLIAEGHRSVYGVRYVETETSSGWSLTADDRPKPAPTEIRFEHLGHLVSLRKDLLPYLGLPVGWTFSTFADGSWHAWSAKDRLLTWLDNFIAPGGATPGDASAIAELVTEQFQGTELHARVVGPLSDWAARDDASPDEVVELLRWALDWLREAPLR